MPNRNAAVRPKERRAAVFIDYENLYRYLQEHPDEHLPPEAVIHDLVAALEDHLRQEAFARITLAFAYADFGRLSREGDARLQHEIYLQGVAPRFVPASLQPAAVEMQLSIEAVDTLHRRPDLDVFVIVTGDRPYLPLVQHLRHCGRTAQVAALAHLRSDLRAEDLFLDAWGLLEDSPAGGSRERSGDAAPPEVLERVSDAAGLRTLELIEDHFGQYEEVYLTPLLRKMSEAFDEGEYDPKLIVGDLEAAGAVWLEKRRGFPYDYTVLLVNAEHPDVQQVQRAAYAEEVPYASFRYEDEAAYREDPPPEAE